MKAKAIIDKNFSNFFIKFEKYGSQLRKNPD